MKQLWLGRRFQLNERGNYAALANSGSERVSVEVDGAWIAKHGSEPFTLLLKRHADIQRAVREKWAAGEATPVLHSFSGRLDHHRLTLSGEELGHLL